MNNMLNSNLLNMLSGIDKSKLEQVSRMVKNMSKEDLNNLVSMLGVNSANETRDSQNIEERKETTSESGNE